MNSSPTILRFCSGSSTPVSRERKRSCACTCTSGTWKWPPNVSTTCSASFSRSSPWSTKTQVSWSPTALCTSSAATAESTPPRQGAEHALAPDLRADALDLLLDHRSGCPGRRRISDVVEEVLQHLLPVRRVHDLGMELDAVEPALAASSKAAIGVDGEPATTSRALGGAVTVSRCDIQTVCSAGRSCEERDSVRGQPRLAELRRARALDACRRARAPSAACRSRSRASECRARRSPGRRAARPPRRPMPARRKGSARAVARAHLLRRDRVRDELRVDAALAHASRDQLRVLPSEVDDQHRALLRRPLRERQDAQRR